MTQRYVISMYYLHRLEVPPWHLLLILTRGGKKLPMQEDIENKSLTLIINTSKLTARTLATAFMKFLRYSRNKIQAHQNVKPQGKQSVKQLIAQNQGVENTELADRNEAKSFDRYARQYGVDYAIQKGYSQEGKPRYILYFKARDRSAINQAMAAYSVAWARQQKQERSAAEPTLDPTREAPAKKMERIRQKGMER